MNKKNPDTILKSKKAIFDNLDLIESKRLEGISYDDIAGLINISTTMLYRYINYNKYINVNKILSTEDKIKLDALNTIGDDTKADKVKDCLYKSCFDRVIDYKDCIVDRLGVEHTISRQLVVPANVSAIRFYLINRKGNEWKNENSQLNLTAGDGSLKSINVTFSENSDAANQERVASIEHALKSNK